MEKIPPALIKDAEVILHLRIKVAASNKKRFLDFCRRAFPIYESTGGNQMFLYEDITNPGYFNEVGYYRTFDDYKCSEHAIQNDPSQKQLIQEWRSLLEEPPQVSIYKATKI